MSEDATAEGVETEPVSTPADAVVDSGKEETPDPKGERKEGEPAESSPAKGNFQDRIDELTRKQRTAERNAEYWRQQALAKEPEPQAVPEKREVKTLEDFADSENPEQAYYEWVSEDVTAKAVDAARREYAKLSAQETGLKKASSFDDREAQYAKSNPDYFETVSKPEHTFFTRDVYELLTELDEGPAVAHYLAKNPDIGKSIARLDSVSAALELGRMEERIKVERSQKGPAVSKAPEPPPKISGSDSGTRKEWWQMSQKEYDAWRRRGGNAKASLQ